MKKLLAPAFAILILIGVFYKWYELQPKNTSPSDSTSTNYSPGDLFTKSSTPSDGTVVDNSAKSVHINIPVPVGGKLRGVIEVGASGFNSFIVRSDNQGRWELVNKEFGPSLMKEGFASVEDIRVGLKNYITPMLDKGVAPNNIHFVVSSGAMKSDKYPAIGKGIKALGYVVNEISAKQEGILALKALLPDEYKHRGYTVDIGSGNTKVSWYEGTTPKSIECYGAKYFQDGVNDEVVFKQVSAAVEKVPADKRDICFIIGGSPMTFAKQTRVDGERFTMLQNPSFYKPQEAKGKAGLNIYRAVYSHTSDVIFDWDANFTIGFLLNL